jgi:hypothetical protein
MMSRGNLYANRILGHVIALMGLSEPGNTILRSIRAGQNLAGKSHVGETLLINGSTAPFMTVVYVPAYLEGRAVLVKERGNGL